MSPDTGLDRVLAALADPTRRRLLDLIASRDHATATELAGSMEISRQGVVKHLSVLARAGLVTSRKEGREVLFRVRGDRLTGTAQWMNALANEWDRRLARIKEIAESG